MVKILVIEDEVDILKEVMDWLTFEGYEAIGATNGRKGLAVFYEKQPDLILCDIAMPDIDGYQVLIELRSPPTLSPVPFIFLTAKADRDSMRAAMSMGADDYITKPFTHDEVLDAISSRLEKRVLQEIYVQRQIDTLESALHEEREQRINRMRLIAMFSHDFRNPLAAILSSSNLLRGYEDRMTPERKQQHFDQIDRSVYLLMQMLDDMMVVSELESSYLHYEPHTMDLPAFVESLADEVRLIDQNKHLLIVQNRLKRLAAFDPKLLRQILMNLLSNAIKYSPENGEVIVTLTKDDEHILLMVEDHGMGIPQEQIDQLFEPFFRADNAKGMKGTGLGLTIVKQAVDVHEGTIHVESQVGQGTRVTIHLPCPQEDAISATT